MELKYAILIKSCDFYFVLIVPYGIEMYILIVILVKHCRVLIVPYGIEIKEST